MELSIPEAPPYAELAAATSIASRTQSDDDKQSMREQAISALDVADEAAKLARKEWEALGKLDSETARCVNCEDWWRASVKDIVRACIACSIAIATMKKGISNAKGSPLREVLTAEIPEAGKRYHDFWIVPKLSIRVR